MPTANETKTLLQKAEQLNEKEKYNEAIELLNDEVLEAHNSAELFTERARAHSVLKQLDENIKYCDKAFAINPDYYKAFNYRGNYWNFKGEYDKAIEDCNKAIALKPDFASAYISRGNSWANKGKYDKAIEDYNKAIALKPDFAIAYNNRGSVWGNKGEYDKTIEDYSKAIVLKPDYAIVYNNRGSVWGKKGEYDKAIEDYSKAIVLKPDYVDAYNNRGFTWHNKGVYDKAIEDCNKAIQLKLDFANPYWVRAMVYDKLEEYDKAIEDYTKAIELNANFNFLQSRIDEAKLKLGEKIEKTEASQNEATLFISDILEEITDTGNKKIIREKSVTALDCMRRIQNHCAIEKPIDVVHYSKLFVADLFLKDVSARQRYGNVVNMNDPEEGRILSLLLKEKDSTKTIERYLEDTRLFEDGDSRHNNIYLGSFLPAPENDSINSHEDELIMWRTYGKDENRNEAAGCSIVIAPEFFFWPPKGDSSHTVMQKMDNAKPAEEKTIKGEVLHRVLYYDKVKKAIVRNDDFGCDEINAEMSVLVQVITDLINLRTTTKEDKKIDDIIYRILSELRHNFKGASYAFENEYRVIIYCEPGAKIGGENIVKVDMDSKQLPRSFYIESANNISSYIRKIYIGPKVPNPERWMYLEVVAKQKGLTKLTVQASGQKFQ